MIKIAKIPLQLLSFIWKMFFLLNFVVSLILLYPLFFLLLLRTKDYPKAFLLTRFWAYWLFFIPGVVISIQRKSGKKKIKGPCVYCSNHTSYLDIMYTYILIPDFFVSMPKQELEKVPLFNILIRKLNIPVDRKSRIDSYRAFSIANEYLRDGVSVFLFPEGTISKNAPHMRPFKNGAFKLAIENKVPVVPITFKNNWKLLQTGNPLIANGRPGIARAVIHEPIETTGMSLEDADELNLRVQKIIENELKT